MSIKTICAGIGAIALIGGLAACGSAHPSSAPVLTVTKTVIAPASPLAAPTATTTVTQTAPAPATSSATTPETLQQYLAANLVSGTYSVTGATVVSATVGAMCSIPYTQGSNWPATGLAAQDVFQQTVGDCRNLDPTGVSGTLSDPNWQSQGIDTLAEGEVQMSDGNQYSVNITVDANQNITWYAFSGS